MIATPPVYVNDFSDGVGPDWSFAGTGIGDAKFDHKNVSVADGIMSVATAPGIDGIWRGGNASLELPQTYGEWRIRARVDAGTGSRYCALLWPANGSWPPEIDFFEGGTNSPDRALTSMTLHFGKATENFMVHKSAVGDFTAWHTIGLVWRPGVLIFSVDGKITGRIDSPNVPSVPMKLHLQTAHKDGVPSLMAFQVSRVKVLA